MNELEDQRNILGKVIKNESHLLDKPLTTSSDVPGNIHNPKFREFWSKVLKADDSILNILENGYEVPLSEFPPPSFVKNNASFLKHSDFGIQELLRLEKLGCIYRVKERPYITLPLSVVYSNKWRLVVDASRHLNPFVEKIHVKLETLDQAELILEKGDFQTSTDLDSGYWHVRLHTNSQQFCGVHFVDDKNEVVYFKWRVLFLGISDAVRIFTKMLKPHRSHLHKNAIRHNAYIDDFRVLGRTKSECLKNTKFANFMLKSAGWILKEEKCSLEPTQSLKFLGQIADTKTMQYFCPEDKKVKIISKIDDVLTSKFIPVRALASLYGKIMSNRKALGETVRLLTRFGYKLIAEAPHWNAPIKITEEVKFELSFLKDNFASLDGSPIRPEKSSILVKSNVRKVASDASAVGEFIYEITAGGLSFKRPFTGNEREESSTSRELKAFEDFYFRFGGALSNQNVEHYTDSKNVEHMLQVGSGNMKYHKRVIRLFLMLRKNNICHKAIWLPRDDPVIQIADEGSRDFDFDDWFIDTPNFLALHESWGPFSIDLFANPSNARVKRFYTLHHHEESAGTNAFAQNLSGEHVWACPPPRLVSPTIKLLWKFKVTGVLCIPAWHASTFWTSICPDGAFLATFVKDFLIFQPVFIAGPDVVSKTFKGTSKFKMLALKVDFNDIVDLRSHRNVKFKIV